jgi:hypothetical protein
LRKLGRQQKKVLMYSFSFAGEKGKIEDSPVITLLTGEAFQVIDVVAGAHYHLECGNHFVTGVAVAGVAK